MHIVVTGAAGNLGSKLRALLERSDWCSCITAIDVVPFEAGPKTSAVMADVGNPYDQGWIVPVRAADGVVNYASANPAPNGNWDQSARSMDMHVNLLLRAGRERPCRYIFASSNHAMGGYKDAPLPPDGKIRMSTIPLSGTHFFVPGNGYEYGAPYGATKILGERASIAHANASGGQLTTVSLRIGYCQRGENLPTTLRSSGAAPGEAVGQPQNEYERDFKWFRNMWLSNGDLDRLLEAALTADSAKWPGPGIVVSGMSNNTGMAWDLEEAAAWIGYHPQDDVWEGLRQAGMV
jgi:nucleoside-diphosphate-sugar epimerase